MIRAKLKSLVQSESLAEEIFPTLPQKKFKLKPRKKPKRLIEISQSKDLTVLGSEAIKSDLG